MVPAHRVLPGVLAAAIRQAPLTPEKVQFAWRQAVGPVVERSTTIRLDDDGVLRVTAADQHWAREVERSSRLILQRLESLLGQNVVRWVDVQAPGRVSRVTGAAPPQRRPPGAGVGPTD
jgi:predicted nucleic acid-binding Zn ribbon protein